MHPKSQPCIIDIDLMPDIDDDAPYFSDDTSLANKMGLKRQTIWWQINDNTLRRPASEINPKEAEKPQKLWHRHVIPKNSGGYRVLHEPENPLKGIQKNLLSTFLYQLDDPDHFGAFVPGRSVFDMARRHVGYPTKLSLDIKDFFHFCHRYKVQEWMKSLGYPKVVFEVVASLVTVPMVKENKDKPIYVLGQGAPTSGAISNWIANMYIDKPIKNILDNSVDCDYVYSRYADNIEISFESEYIDKEDLLSQIRPVLESRHFYLNEKKTKFQKKKHPHQAMRVLGINVGEKLNIPGPEYKRLRAMVHNCLVNGFEEESEKANRSGAGDMYDYLSSKLEYWSNIREDRIKPVRDKLEEARRKHF